MVLWLYSLWVVIADYVREHTFVEFCTLGECLLLYENCNSKGKKKSICSKKGHSESTLSCPDVLVNMSFCELSHSSRRGLIAAICNFWSKSNWIIIVQMRDA